MKQQTIERHMRGNMVWCRNGRFAMEATPCEQVTCPFKGNTGRLATALELSICETFQITRPSGTWDHAYHVYPKGSDGNAH